MCFQGRRVKNCFYYVKVEVYCYIPLQSQGLPGRPGCIPHLHLQDIYNANQSVKCIKFPFISFG